MKPKRLYLNITGYVLAAASLGASLPSSSGHSQVVHKVLHKVVHKSVRKLSGLQIMSWRGCRGQDLVATPKTVAQELPPWRCLQRCRWLLPLAIALDISIFHFVTSQTNGHRNNKSHTHSSEHENNIRRWNLTRMLQI